MIKLNCRAKPHNIQGWVVGVATRVQNETDSNTILVVDNDQLLRQLAELDGNIRGVVTTYSLRELPEKFTQTTPILHSAQSLEHISKGHILLLSSYPGGANTLFRPESSHNSLFITERCNSNCLMCSQPPKDVDDSFLFKINRRLIELLPIETEVLGITGGEPTLYDSELFELLDQISERLPNVLLQMLSNGRRFAWPAYAREFAAHAPKSLRVGVPLYSSIANEHDYVVQARGAFDQTISGLRGLFFRGISTEIRVVIHALTASYLKEIADFVYHNFASVDHVTFMGLEMMGHVHRNLEILWIDPVDYQAELVQAVEYLAVRGMNVSVYNHQLCTLDPKLWGFAPKSISDYKNIYLQACDRCEVLDQCGGLFLSAAKRHSQYIKPISQDGRVLA